MQLLLILLLMALGGGKVPEGLEPLLEASGGGELETLAAALKSVNIGEVSAEKTQKEAEELMFAAVASIIPEDILRAMREYLTEKQV